MSHYLGSIRVKVIQRFESKKFYWKILPWESISYIYFWVAYISYWFPMENFYDLGAHGRAMLMGLCFHKIGQIGSSIDVQINDQA